MGWRTGHWAALAATLVVGIAVRIALLPAEGLRGDLDQFVGWVHHIARNGLGSLYQPTEAGPVTFGPVMGYVWAVLAGVQPAFQTATDASDLGIRVLMKVPASLADIGLAVVVAYALRARPGWAVVGAAAILLHPAVIDVSAWWGQYESIYVLAAAIAAVLAINDRNGWAAAAIALALMTKPQALPMLVPFAAWFWARNGWTGLARAGAIGLAVAALVWLPFIPTGGPAGYLSNLATYQNEIFAVASLRAWNLWWLFQTFAAGGSFVADGPGFVGPVSLRLIGYLLAGAMELLVAVVIVRDPRPRTLLLGLATAVLGGFALLTQMHERYAFGGVAFLALLLPDRRLRWVGAAFGLAFTANLLAAVPPTTGIGSVLPVGGAVGVVGSISMLAITAIVAFLVVDRREDDGFDPAV